MGSTDRNWFPNPTIEDEHRAQLRSAQRVRQALRDPASAFDVRAELANLLTESAVHFGLEQLLMRLCAYPDYSLHLQEHDRILAMLQDAASMGAGAPSAQDAALIDRTLERIGLHIAGSDREFGQYYRQWLRIDGVAGREAEE